VHSNREPGMQDLPTERKYEVLIQESKNPG
jgi:hypothetical protein